MKGSAALGVSKSLKIIVPGLTAISVVNTGYDIFSDGVLYGIVDVGVFVYTGGTSLTSMVKTGIDSNFKKLPANANTISVIVSDHPDYNLYRIRAMHNGQTRISINFYTYEVYKTMRDRIYP